MIGNYAGFHRKNNLNLCRLKMVEVITSLFVGDNIAYWKNKSYSCKSLW